MTLNSINNKIEIILIIISSTLLGIWATENTIALRNILLLIGFFFGTIYWILQINKYKIKDNQFICKKKWITMLLLITLYFWIIFQYVFITELKEIQFKELKSTWVRSALGCYIGLAAGIVLQRRKNYAWLLIFGILMSYILLITQYIPKAITDQRILAPDFFGNYIYDKKFNGVLVGIIAISIILGQTLDIKRETERHNNVNKPNYEKKLFNNIKYKTYLISGYILIIYSFIFIFDSKNGVGITLILTIAWFLITLYYNRAQAFISFKYYHLIIIIIATILFIQHFHQNKGWKNIIEDVYIGIDIKKYDNWKNPEELGYPLRNDGSPVRGNTYLRAAWATKGFEEILKKPLGTGITNTFQYIIDNENSDKNIKGISNYTHSAWIDIGLSYGIPSLLLIIPILLIIIKDMIWNYHYYKFTCIFLSTSILILYTIGEYGSKHGIEILIFILSILITLSKNGIKKVNNE